MKFTYVHVFIIGLVGLILGGVAGLANSGFLYRVGGGKEGLLVRVGGGAEGFRGPPGNFLPPPFPPFPYPPPSGGTDMSQFVLKSQLQPSTPTPDMTSYMLKTECPPVPDLSKYVLKASIPKPQPVIIDNSSCQKDAGECPPCPRPRCPTVKCPKPEACPVAAPCPRQECPKTVVKCKSEEASQDIVRPFLAPLNMGGFGSA